VGCNISIAEIFSISPYIGLFTLLILGGIGIPFFPEDATFILCGFLIRGGVAKPIPALLAIYIGVLIADLILYSIGRKYGRMIVCHRWFQRLLSAEKLTILESKYKKRGVAFILLGRHFIGIRAQIFLVSGVMRMHPLRFLLADAFTVIFTIALMVSIGYVGGHSLKDIGVDTSRVGLIAVLLFGSLSAGYLLFKYIKGKLKQ
jgi:membrane protein DedA with SNARE-associated domain